MYFEVIVSNVHSGRVTRKRFDDLAAALDWADGITVGGAVHRPCFSTYGEWDSITPSCHLRNWRIEVHHHVPEPVGAVR